MPVAEKTYPEDMDGPDEIVSEEQKLMYPDTRVVPFHYTHPVTGQEFAEQDLRAPVYGEAAKHAKPTIKLED